MERVRTLIFENGSSKEITHYYNDYGIEITPDAYTDEVQRRKQLLTRFECPVCHFPTFGHFEPFAERGIIRWCSNCGHQEIDNDKFREYMSTHDVASVEVE